MTRFEKWVKDTDTSTQLKVAFICEHYKGHCKYCPIKGICTDDVEVHNYLMAESEDRNDDR